ncbi:hypothetical protein [Streptomyces sp. AMCC400023]|uniref:hypothetical protein n=1 Tax=Streptomyces sp. AMCC400023 TaxID=2056258 RepID=UPI001F45C156|nr:hypothetical protein [Streptomyces sp. AMCC400023]UJV42977.1 hypothetical protein CVT30_26835 [Streptomyces sp. AMCC400023]
MGCACGKKKEQFAVITADGNGRQVYASTDKNLAVKVSARYVGSVVKDKDGTVVHRNTPPPAAPAASTERPK